MFVRDHFLWLVRPMQTGKAISDTFGSASTGQSPSKWRTLGVNTEFDGEHAGELFINCETISPQVHIDVLMTKHE